MLKKVVIGSMLCALIGVLVVGGLVRTSNRLDRNSQDEGDRRGRQADGVQGAGTGYRGGQQASLQAADASIPLGQENRAGSRGQGRGGVVGEAGSESSRVAKTWLQVDGSVQTASDDTLTLVLSNGETLVLEGRSWRYASELGFVAQEGDWITLLGFYEDGEWKTAEIGNHTTGLTVIIRSDSGRPMWAGRGRQGT